ncbi:hypothetical protein EW026_g5845 [Hermanssonia centrifuga]|uniref:Uncharacterized protein n=1 Tax=Hermanssonia centrifuga TaxID=98765 RepID=A0A4S4KDV8_9APHY|nr:hypothetical protein EW026_g5845 [Hermanssonia centrifuga]
MFLPLNIDTVIIFLHAEDTGLSSSYAAQVTIASNHSEDAGIINVYRAVQEDIAVSCLSRDEHTITPDAPGRIL